MSVRVLGGGLAVFALVLFTPLPVAGQAGTADSHSAHTPWGTPNLQGIWDFRDITPLERPDQYAGRESLTAEEVPPLTATPPPAPHPRVGPT